MNKGLIITMTTEEYERTDSGKSWRTNPVSVETREISYQQMERITEDDTLRFFRRLGGYERVDWGYTCIGYEPIQCTSISPAKDVKKICTFRYEMKKEIA